MICHAEVTIYKCHSMFVENWEIRNVSL